MKRKWIFIPIITLLIIGVILGSFYDLSIAKALYSRINGFGLTMAAFGETPVYAFMGTLGFGFVWLCKDYKKGWQRAILIFLAVAALGCCTYFQGRHIFNVNAYNKPKLTFLGLGLGLLIGLIGAGIGYFLFKSSDLTPKQLLFVLLFIAACIGVSVGLNQLTKIFMSRPRFRFLADMDVIQEYYCNWWESGHDVRKLYLSSPVHFPNGDLVTKEEFKSFPSGHMANTTAVIAIMGMLPVINKNIKLRSDVLMGIGMAWCLLLAFTRMLVGAHFLSDVSMGMLMTVLVVYVLNEVFLRVYDKYAEAPQLNE